jgi:hypothetical protein
MLKSYTKDEILLNKCMANRYTRKLPALNIGYVVGSELLLLPSSERLRNCKNIRKVSI